MASRIPIHVSNHTALVWDVDRALQHRILQPPLELNTSHTSLSKRRRRHSPLKTPHLRRTLGHAPQSLPAERIPRSAPSPHARRARPPPRKPFVAPSSSSSSSSSPTSKKKKPPSVMQPHAELATIVHDPSAHHAPTPAQLESWDASRRQDIAQHQLARLDRQQRQRRSKAEDKRTTTTTTTAAGSPIDDVVQDSTTIQQQQQKRVERQARRRRWLAATADNPDDPDGAGADADAEPDDADAETTTTTDAAEAIGVGDGRTAPAPAPAPAPIPSGSSAYTVSVPTTSYGLAWYNYDEDGDGDDPASGPRRRRNQPQRTYETLDAARAAGVWSYPSNARERARCEVFRDLWEKGYYMGGGIKFGGDWLVYPGASSSSVPSLFFFFLKTFHSRLVMRFCVRACGKTKTKGDPLRYHSHFVATVQAFPSAPLRPMEVVAHGRLGTATKKAHLLCGWDPESRKVTYISIEWAGFG